MTNKQKVIYIVVAAVVILAVGVGIFKVKKGGKDEPVITPTANVQQKQEDNKPKATEAKSDVWTGTLKASDNSKKGNLMLVMSDRTVYIRTSRDFSGLVGKKVNVSYEGTIDSFVLGNITEAKAE